MSKTKVPPDLSLSVFVGIPRELPFVVHHGNFRDRRLDTLVILVELPMTCWAQRAVLIEQGSGAVYGAISTLGTCAGWEEADGLSDMGTREREGCGRVVSLHTPYVKRFRQPVLSSILTKGATQSRLLHRQSVKGRYPPAL